MFFFFFFFFFLVQVPGHKSQRSSVTQNGMLKAMVVVIVAPLLGNLCHVILNIFYVDS